MTRKPEKRLLMRKYHIIFLYTLSLCRYSTQGQEPLHSPKSQELSTFCVGPGTSHVLRTNLSNSVVKSGIPHNHRTAWNPLLSAQSHDSPIFFIQPTLMQLEFPTSTIGPGISQVLHNAWNPLNFCVKLLYCRDVEIGSKAFFVQLKFLISTIGPGTSHILHIAWNPLTFC